eukprot:m.79826 g.79826  ORF g.79826 m.79826 type:complete len:107 (-) comp10849_c0_seq1:620-940(-)
MESPAYDGSGRSSSPPFDPSRALGATVVIANPDCDADMILLESSRHSPTEVHRSEQAYASEAPISLQSTSLARDRRRVVFANHLLCGVFGTRATPQWGFVSERRQT